MKKELVGNYGNSGQEWQPEGHPVEVDVYDFPDPDIPKAVKRAGDPTLTTIFPAAYFGTPSKFFQPYRESRKVVDIEKGNHPGVVPPTPHEELINKK